MNSETTTCISIENDKILKDVSKKYNISVSKIVVLMVKYANEKNELSITSDRNVKYRDKNNSTWRRIHLQLYQNEYEFLLDVKKIWKMSVAKIIEYCIENFLFELIEKVLEKDKTDNYLYNNYHFEIGEEDGIIYYLIYWGLPLKILQELIQKQPDTHMVT